VGSFFLHGGGDVGGGWDGGDGGGVCDTNGVERSLLLGGERRGREKK